MLVTTAGPGVTHVLQLDNGLPSVAPLFSAPSNHVLHLRSQTLHSRLVRILTTDPFALPIASTDSTEETVLIGAMKTISGLRTVLSTVFPRDAVVSPLFHALLLIPARFQITRARCVFFLVVLLVRPELQLCTNVSSLVNGS